MIEAARRRTKADIEGDGDDDDDDDDDDDGAMYDGRIAVEVGDATDPPPGPCDVVFSAFGLQQLPHPMSAALTWIDRLGGGVRLRLLAASSAGCIVGPSVRTVGRSREKGTRRE